MGKFLENKKGYFSFHQQTQKTLRTKEKFYVTLLTKLGIFKLNCEPKKKANPNFQNGSFVIHLGRIYCKYNM